MTKIQTTKTNHYFMALVVLALGATMLLTASKPSYANASFTVTNTNDSGAGSLKQAILDANANLDADSICFAIPGSGA